MYNCIINSKSRDTASVSIHWDPFSLLKIRGYLLGKITQRLWQAGSRQGMPLGNTSSSFWEQDFGLTPSPSSLCLYRAPFPILDFHPISSEGGGTIKKKQTKKTSLKSAPSHGGCGITGLAANGRLRFHKINKQPRQSAWIPTDNGMKPLLPAHPGAAVLPTHPPGHARERFSLEMSLDTNELQSRKKKKLIPVYSMGGGSACAGFASQEMAPHLEQPHTGPALGGAEGRSDTP